MAEINTTFLGSKPEVTAVATPSNLSMYFADRGDTVTVEGVAVPKIKTIGFDLFRTLLNIPSDSYTYPNANSGTAIVQDRTVYVNPAQVTDASAKTFATVAEARTYVHTLMTAEGSFDAFAWMMAMDNMDDGGTPPTMTTWANHPYTIQLAAGKYTDVITLEPGICYKGTGTGTQIVNVKVAMSGLDLLISNMSIGIEDAVIVNTVVPEETFLSEFEYTLTQLGENASDDGTAYLMPCACYINCALYCTIDPLVMNFLINSQIIAISASVVYALNSYGAGSAAEMLIVTLDPMLEYTEPDGVIQQLISSGATPGMQEHTILDAGGMAIGELPFDYYNGAEALFNGAGRIYYHETETIRGILTDSDYNNAILYTADYTGASRTETTLCGTLAYYSDNDRKYAVPLKLTRYKNYFATSLATRQDLAHLNTKNSYITDVSLGRISYLYNDRYIHDWSPDVSIAPAWTTLSIGVVSGCAITSNPREVSKSVFVGGKDSEGAPTTVIYTGDDESVSAVTVTIPAGFTARYDAQCATYSNSVYIFGGKDASNNMLTDIWKLTFSDTTTAVLTEITPTNAFPARDNMEFFYYNEIYKGGYIRKSYGFFVNGYAPATETASQYSKAIYAFSFGDDDGKILTSSARYDNAFKANIMSFLEETPLLNLTADADDSRTIQGFINNTIVVEGSLCKFNFSFANATIQTTVTACPNSVPAERALSDTIYSMSPTTGFYDNNSPRTIDADTRGIAGFPYVHAYNTQTIEGNDYPMLIDAAPKLWRNPYTYEDRVIYVDAAAYPVKGKVFSTYAQAMDYLDKLSSVASGYVPSASMRWTVVLSGYVPDEIVTSKSYIDIVGINGATVKAIKAASGVTASGADDPGVYIYNVKIETIADSFYDYGNSIYGGMLACYKCIVEGGSSALDLSHTVLNLSDCDIRKFNISAVMGGYIIGGTIQGDAGTSVFPSNINIYNATVLTSVTDGVTFNGTKLYGCVLNSNNYGDIVAVGASFTECSASNPLELDSDCTVVNCSGGGFKGMEISGTILGSSDTSLTLSWDEDSETPKHGTYFADNTADAVITLPAIGSYTGIAKGSTFMVIPASTGAVTFAAGDYVTINNTNKKAVAGDEVKLTYLGSDTWNIIGCSQVGA